MALGIALYKQSLYWHFIKTEGEIINVNVSTSRNRTTQGCIVAYQYEVKYVAKNKQTYTAQHEHSVESTTCRTDEIKTGEQTTVYYKPENPAVSVQYTNDSVGAGLYLFVVFGSIALIVQGIIAWWRGR